MNRLPLPLILLAASALMAAPARSQAVLGFGDDATTPRAGAVRIGFNNIWTRFDQRFEAPSGASITTRSQARATPMFLEIGLASRLAIGALVPAVGTKVIATYFPDTARAIHADSVREFDQSGAGDAAAWAKFVWLGALTERERVRTKGFHVRSSLTALARFPTGQAPLPSQQFGLGTGTRETALEVGSQWDFLMGPHFWASIVGRYGHHFAAEQSVRVAPRDDPFATNVGPVEATRQLGNYFELEATPRIGLGEYFSIGAQYRFRHKGRDTYSPITGATPTSGQPPDLSVLESGSEITEHRAGFGIVYSSVAAHALGHGLFPVEVSFRYLRTVAASGTHPKPSEYAVGVRVYAKVWGR